VIWQYPFDIHKLTKRVDSRGFLFEILRFTDDDIPGQGQIYTFSIEPRQRRGDHYHKRKREWFTCVYGRAIVLLSNAEGKTCACEISSDDPCIVYAAPTTAHALLNETGQVAVVVSYGSEQHNPDDEDTFPQIAYSDYDSKQLLK
jgi:UDP-2-acetamido-2,6-beta-L-arabino-hexul-4-ose reductase